MYELKLPDLGEGIHEGEIVRWHVAEGQPVGQDEPLVDVLTDKATVTIPSPVKGQLARQGGKPGDIVKVGQVLALLDTDAAARPPAQPAAPPATPTQTTTPPAAAQAPAAQVSPTAARTGLVPAAPATRRLARELGIDLSQVQGTGPGGRVTPEDLETFKGQEGEEFLKGEAGGRPAQPTPSPSQVLLASPASPSMNPSSSGSPGSPSQIPLSSSFLFSPEPLPDFSQQGPVEREPLRGVRRLTARRMVTAATLVPHVAHFDEADVTSLEALRQRHKARLAAQGGPPLSLLPFVLRAVTRSLQAHPKLNASLDLGREEIVYKKFYDLGVAVASPRGLVVPVVRGAERRTVVELAVELSRLAEAAREDRLEAAELRGGTFTITNIGPIGGLAATPIVNYPEVAILALGRAQEQARVRDAQVAVRRILPLVLSFDHRLIDGADAARFVNDVVRLLEEPEALLLGG